jgi:hypothetical protein
VQPNKRIKTSIEAPPEESSDKTLFAILALPTKIPQHRVPDTEKLSTFSNLLQKFTADHSVEPVSCYFISYIHLRGSRGISDIPPRHPYFTKVS